LVEVVGAVIILMTACGSSSSSGSEAQASSSSQAPPSSPASTSAASSFTSSFYGYAVDLPGGWLPESATEVWSGELGDFGSDAPASDRFQVANGETIWAVSAATTKTVDQMMEDALDWDAVDHDCDPVPDSDEQVTIGGEPARLTAKNCPVTSETVIATAALIHGETGYYFYFRHSELQAPDPNAVDNFKEFLSGVSFE
jgi:hypothetical protein